MNEKQSIWLIIGCTIPLLLLFVAPALGVSGNTGLFIIILVMFASHLLIPHGHGKQEHENRKAKTMTDYEKEQDDEQHSH